MPNEPVNPRIHEPPRLIRLRQYALQLRRIENPVFAPIDTPRLRFCSDTSLVALLRQLFHNSQILIFLVVAHVDHYVVEQTQVGGLLDYFRGLCVVHGQADGYAGGGADRSAEGGEV